MGGSRCPGRGRVSWACTSDGTAAQLTLEEALCLADRSGRHARRVGLCGCVAAMCGGMTGAVAPFLLGPATTEFGLDNFQLGLLGSSMFIGMWIGSFVGGPLCDSAGPGTLRPGKTHSCLCA